jgi:hypothetical protein
LINNATVFDEPYQCNHIVTKFKVIFSNNLKKCVRKISGLKLLLYKVDIVCSVLKGAEKPTCTRTQNREKHNFGLI